MRRSAVSFDDVEQFTTWVTVRLRPTPEQAAALSETLAVCQEVAGWAEQRCREMYADNRHIDFSELSRDLTALKRQNPRFRAVYSTTLQWTIRRVFLTVIRKGKNQSPLATLEAFMSPVAVEDNHITIPKISGKPRHLGGIVVDDCEDQPQLTAKVQCDPAGWSVRFKSLGDTLIFAARLGGFVTCAGMATVKASK